MAEKRKLLNEIDKCYKKVDEGFEIFDDIMEKMAEANSDNQREKFQDDLKKEIKKLQRLRDQIKGWQNSSDIKDKDSLAKFRKLIENRMEIFKDVERENKTKPHSKQGLSAEDKLDPKEKEKCDTIEWLNCQIRRIQDEIDRTESKLETLSSTADTGKKRGKNKDAKGNDKEKTEELRKHLERVKFHLLNLEVCMRLINNEKLDIKDVLTKLKEPLEMYIDALDPENDDDPESLDPEDIYEELNFGTYLSQLGGISMNSIDDEKIGPNNDNGSHKSASPTPESWGTLKHQNGDVDAHEKGTIVATGSTTAMNTKTASESVSSHKSIISAGGSSIASLKLSRLGSQVSNASSSIASPLPQTPPAIPGIPYNSVAAGKLHTPPVQSSTQPIPIVPIPTTPNNPSKSFAAASSPENPPMALTNQNVDMVSPIPESKEEATIPAAPVAQRTSSVTSSTATAHEEVVQNSPVSTASRTPIQLPEEVITSATTSSNPAPPLHQQPNQAEFPPSHENSPEMVPSNMQDADYQHELLCSSEFNGKMTPKNLLFNSSLMNPMLSHQIEHQHKSKEPQETSIPPWLGASPLGLVPMSEDLNYQLHMLENTMQRCPVQMDSEKPRSYLPKMPCQTPSYYPQAPLPNADSLEYYLRLSVETLFFTFYYMEGSRAQLLAAKALKKLSWRFHTKYLMWFQRHEEPKQITDDYEQGTYVYFDFEKWVQRKKEQFTFEYKYLEDKDFE